MKHRAAFQCEDAIGEGQHQIEIVLDDHDGEDGRWKTWCYHGKQILGHTARSGNWSCAARFIRSRRTATVPKNGHSLPIGHAGRTDRLVGRSFEVEGSVLVATTVVTAQAWGSRQGH